MATSQILIPASETEKPASTHEDEHLLLKKEFSFQEIKRGETIEPTKVDLEEGDLLQFEFDDDTVWLCSHDDLEELFDEVAIQKKRDLTADSGENPPILIPTELVMVDQRRGLKKILVKFLKIFGRKKVENLPAELDDIIRKLATDFEDKALDKERGLLGLERDFTLRKTEIKEEGKYFLFLHGTAASTRQSFATLSPDGQPTELWNTIFDNYKTNVLAFEHESLTKSPLQNVLELVGQLPNKATLHILSQSRGGLIGEILSRFCIENSGGRGFSDKETTYLNRVGRAAEVKLIEEIRKLMRAKTITIEKFVRVACPANGAILASKRLDVLLNVISNLAGLALRKEGEVYTAFRNLLSAAVEIKNNPSVLPGLEVQNPESPFIQVLNNPTPELEITAPLLVVMGNNKVTFRWSAIVSILAKMFNMGPNDLIVNTRSMFNGAKRAIGKSQYYLDEGPLVNHFNYFANKSTRDAILNAVQNDGLRPVPGFMPLTDRDFTGAEIRNISLTNPKGRLFPVPVSGNKPIVILLPGIMGSNLTVRDKQVWINFLSIMGGRLTTLEHSDANNRNIMAPSVVEASYKKLTDYLSPNYDVVVFPFDWRLNIAQSGEALNSKIVELLQFQQPIKLIAHSMGGLVIRDFMTNKNYKNTWAKLNEYADFRLLFLGSPLGGSFRIPYILFGEDSIIRTVSALDLDKSKRSLLTIFSQFPGILSLLPLDETDDDNNFGLVDTWHRMAKALGDDQWPLPDATLLAEFNAYRNQVKKSIPDYDKAVYIAGQAGKRDQTISGYRIRKRKTFFGPTRETLEFLATKEGDGSVTWASGIPKAVADNNVYFSDVSHGELANDPALFEAIADILREGKTNQLSQTQPSFRGGEVTESVAKVGTTFDLSPDNLEKVVLGLRSSPDHFVTGQSPMIVSVSNGDLKYARYPLLIGHFDRDGILSAEKAIDQLLHGEVSKRIYLGLYPGPIESNAYLETENLGKLKGVIVVGLGKQGELNEFQLINTIELGVCNYLVGLIGKSFNQTHELTQKPKTIGISALLVGSGYGGMSIEGAVRAILQAIQTANQKILAAYQEMGLAVEAVEFIELYTDRALACVKAVSTLEKEGNKVWNIKRSGNSINNQPGRRGRLPVEDTKDWWTRINVQLNEDPENLDKRRQALRFAVSTDAARVEEDTLTTDSYDLFGILDAISIRDEWTSKLAKVIFEMLIPNDFKQLIKRQNNISWQLDSLTAAFPWELLQDSQANAKPLSVNAGMIRQLATPNFRRGINSVIENNALVVADPKLEGFFSQLPGARKEGGRIAAKLKANGYNLVHASNEKSAKIRIELLGQDYKIIHLAGHGAFEFGPFKKTGMVIGKDAFLTPDDINQMSGVPELVFVNCCYLGQMAALPDENQLKPYRLAANIGTRLIEIGVKAVVVAGWAVSDAIALEFAEKFYDGLFSGHTFGESVKRARQAIFENYGTHNNTWGAYQCYGDPFYRLIDPTQNQSYEYTFIIPEEAEIELNNMLNQLDTGSYEVEVFRKKIKGIALGMERAKISNGKIIELQALLYAGMGMYPEAIAMFGKLGTLEDSVFSFSAWEKYCNVRAKLAVQNFQLDPKNRENCRKEIQSVAEEINALNRLGCTNERLNLLGSTYKRLGLVSTSSEKLTAYETSAGYYRQSANQPTNSSRFYSLANWLAIENALVLTEHRKWGQAIQPFSAFTNLPKSTRSAIAQIKKELEQQLEVDREETNFWDSNAEANLRLVLMLLGDKETPYSAVKEAYEKVWKFTGHKGNRLGVLEYLDFLIDMYGLAPVETVKKVLDSIARLRRELEAIG